MRRSSTEPNILQRIRGEQIRTLYGQSSPVLLANVVNAVIVSCALWEHAAHALLIAWTGAMVCMAVLRIELRRRYWAGNAGAAQAPSPWATRFTLGSLSAGLLWGFAAWELMPDSLPHQVLIVFVIGGMAAGAAASIACFMPAYYAYVVPSLLPVVVRLWSFGGKEHLAMLAMLVLFAGALTVVAHNVSRALTQAFSLRFENAELYLQVSQAQASLAQANTSLRQSNEELETRVAQRTAELRTSQAQLAEIVRESPDAIVVLEASGRIVSANPAAERISGRPASALVGKHFADADALVHDAKDRALEEVQRLLAGEERPVQEYRVEHTDGQARVVEMKMRVVSGLDGQRRIHAVLRDVTERDRLRRLKEAYELRLREAERLESVGMLAGGVAHDFNNVLTTVLVNLDLLDTLVNAPEVKACLSEIRHGSQQAASLTKQLLAFSRRQLLDPQLTDLVHVVSRARAVYERALGEHNHLVVRLPDEPLVAMVDATQIEQALLNLLVNARHAMPDGGCVELELQRVELRDNTDWPEAPSGAYVRIAVRDTGTGMDEATRSRVFEPFFTTRMLGRGTGLGLSSVHGLVKQAGGFIRVQSELGNGSRFEILLPAQQAVAAEPMRAEQPAWSPGSGSVLLVEDQPQLRRYFERILQDAGYRVLAAEDGERALERVREYDGRIDLLVTDVIMPGLSGIELSRRLLALYPRLAVLLISGYAGSEITRLAELGEHVQFLQKPFDAVGLTAAAHAVLTRARSAQREAHATNLTN